MPVKKVLCIVGARPNFMKIAPIMRAFDMYSEEAEAKLVHTGQHYDYAMNETFFQQLEIPVPDISLEVGSGSHALQTAEIMKRFDLVLESEQPDCVLVVGDVNSSLACALVAAKKNIKVVHVEAGLRSGDRTMPEEINRVLTDQLSDRLYVTERTAIDNLKTEGIAANKIMFAGNVMIDTVLHSLARAVPVSETIENAIEAVKSEAGIDQSVFKHAGSYAVLTLHRPSNVDDQDVLKRLLSIIKEISVELPVIFPVHPRTRAKILDSGQGEFLKDPRILILPPLGYFEMLGLVRDASVVLTDSGGLQEETTALGVPCLTLRENTERPITITNGTNTLVGSDRGVILAALNRILNTKGKLVDRPEKWDGMAASRIVKDVVLFLGAGDRVSEPKMSIGV
ncbi:UDP-N-acetylglucosamine 2-epimerase (non-hydrolyzing) [Rhodanobacter sp. FDAARGOS 1247]|uniref:non-hydrolyzing UDP-N-acetylglucosamine 2-epimerase n=1 Tax=Rhodanobacter sp. FDAARGOS 1247 TaxID=2778082 RepID=UPI0019521E19|nr:UDP-N-acetylglucosamine 2-epimerase (non-hydrolyzing) [Rhodanobacter sp. FDAARGOS 1247]QRP64502.1 UDP-N-acetylglucosamine 2-epimerase (non-hydrolyzing) [Rhodanobacter sp. FDAARGOS 1247]